MNVSNDGFVILKRTFGRCVLHLQGLTAPVVCPNYILHTVKCTWSVKSDPNQRGVEKGSGQRILLARCELPITAYEKHNKQKQNPRQRRGAYAHYLNEDWTI